MDLKSDGSRFFNYLKGKINLRTITIIVAIIAILSTSGIVVFASLVKDVTVIDDQKTIKISTFKKSVKEVLEENDIVLSKQDKVMPALNVSIGKKSTIVIRRAIPVVIKDGNVEKSILTNKKTIAELLKEQNIVLNEKDKLSVELTAKIIKNLIVQITRVTEDTIVEKEKIAYSYTQRNTTAISRGQKRVVKEGKVGEKQVTYKTTYENGQVVNKELVKSKVVKSPVKGIVEVGVEPQTKATRSGDLRFSKEIVMSASAYTAGFESTGKRPGDRGYGRTATGVIAQHGVVAVDPRVIPLGTKLYIESLDGYPSYGYAVAADKGSAIKGSKIDLFYDSLSDAQKFGRRKVKVYILE